MASGFLKDRHKLTIATLVVAFVFLFALNAFSNAVFRGESIDFTKDREFTLSPGTVKVLENIEEPVTLRLFVSPALTEKVPTYAAAAERVRNLLKQYASIARGKIKLEFYAPKPFSEDEDRAAAYGIDGIPLDQGGEKIYFGLAGTNSTDEEKKIAFFHPNRARFIEYDLTRLVHSLGTKKKVVGLIASLPINGSFSMRTGMTPPWEVMKEVAKAFEVKTVSADKAIPKDIDVLMIVHPGRLDDKSLYNIDQYVLRGGHALVLVDPVPESAPRRRTMIGAGPVAPGSDLPKLLKSWGVAYDRLMVAADARRAVRVPTKYQGQSVYAPHIGYLQLRKEDFNDKDPVTASLKTMIMGTAGYLAKAKDAVTTVTPLIWTSANATPQKAQPFRAPQADLVGLAQAYKPGDKKLWLAVRVTGKAKSAFPNGLDKKDDKNKTDKKSGDDKKDEKTAAPLKEATDSINVIVVADVDFLQESFWAQKQRAGQSEILVPFANNADFVTNALDNLSGATALMELRGRGSPTRPFTLVEDIQKESSARLRAKQKELADKLKEVRKKIDEARTKSKDGSTVLTEAEQASLRGYMTEFLRIRREQREVLFALREDVEALESRMKFYNIALIPLVIALIAIIVAVLHIRRRRRRHGIGGTTA
ncbi:MAG: Gldg family protein [Bauldia litoralis]